MNQIHRIIDVEFDRVKLRLDACRALAGYHDITSGDLTYMADQLGFKSYNAFVDYHRTFDDMSFFLQTLIDSPHRETILKIYQIRRGICRM